MSNVLQIDRNGIDEARGLAITVGLTLLIEGISYLSNSVDRNTEAKNKEKEDPTTIRAQNEESFINAVRLAIKEGILCVLNPALWDAPQ